MKKLVLAIGLVIASSVNVFSQSNICVGYWKKMFLETYNINDARNINFSDSIPEIVSYFTDKINNRGNNESFNENIDLELYGFTSKNAEIVGFKSIDVSEYSEIITKIEFFKIHSLCRKDKNNQYSYYSIYFTYQDVHGRWYSSDWILKNDGKHF